MLMFFAKHFGVRYRTRSMLESVDLSNAPSPLREVPMSKKRQQPRDTVERLAQPEIPCSICKKPVDLSDTKTDAHGKAVHEECYVPYRLVADQRKLPRRQDGSDC
jgi:hypothetical protein